MANSNFLSVDDLVTVQSKAWGARGKWYNIGLQLGLKVDDLDCLQKQNTADIDICFREMLKVWLRQGDTEKTWDRLIIALKSEMVNYGDLANSIEDEFTADSGACEAPKFRDRGSVVMQRGDLVSGTTGRVCITQPSGMRDDAIGRQHVHKAK